MPMGTYTKIKVIMLYTLNNAEYLAYMNSVLALLPPPSGGEEDPERLHVGDVFVLSQIDQKPLYLGTFLCYRETGDTDIRLDDLV